MTYRPKLLDLSGVELPPEIAALSEHLAENAHGIWASQRIADGWTYGPARDDAQKKHPCLVPYVELPESEKLYDRRLAIDTLKTILLLGYRIERGLPPGR